MNIYKLSLIISEILAIIISGFWIIYKIKKLEFDDLIINMSTYILFLYVAIGELVNKIKESE